MITSKQRSYLGKLANEIPDIVFIGKNGITNDILDQVRNNLKARELIKCKIQQNSDMTAKEAADIIAEKIHCDVVRTIGNKFVLYKKNLELKNNIIPSKNAIRKEKCKKVPNRKKSKK